MAQQMRQSSLGFWQRVGRFLRGLVRLVLFGLIVAIITAALYYAFPYIYNSNVFPLQNNNQVGLERLQRAQTQLQDDLTDQLTRQRERIAQLEANLTAEREARSELENKLAQQTEAISAQTAVLAELKEQLETQTPATDQTDLEARLEAQGQTIAALEESVDALDTFLTNLDTTVAGVEQAVTEPGTEVAPLQQQLLVLQAGQAILKARLHFAENNPGQAKLSLERVGLVLERLADLISPEKEDALTRVQIQLEVATTAIDEQPFIAVQELEILWELLQRLSESEEPGNVGE